jgi:hypothetical protein
MLLTRPAGEKNKRSRLLTFQKWSLLAWGPISGVFSLPSARWATFAPCFLLLVRILGRSREFRSYDKGVRVLAGLIE